MNSVNSQSNGTPIPAETALRLTQWSEGEPFAVEILHLGKSSRPSVREGGGIDFRALDFLANGLARSWRARREGKAGLRKFLMVV